jgi:hypothetical protein
VPALLMGSRVRTRSRVCCVASGLCDELITRPEESYRVWCVCDLETLTVRLSRPECVKTEDT